MTGVCIACYFYSVVTKLLSFTQTENCNVFISEHYRILCYINFSVHNYWNFIAASTFPSMFFFKCICGLYIFLSSLIITIIGFFRVMVVFTVVILCDQVKILR